MMLRVLLTPILLGALAVAPSATAAREGRVVQVEGGATSDLPSRTSLARGVADTVPARSDSVREYRGLYETGFEVSWFHPCDAQPGDDSWWVTLTNEALQQRDSLTKTLTGQPRRLFVRWRGTVSPKMPAGAVHLGRGSRYMLVSQVISVRASDEMGCTSA
jgi:hypothetical protein